MTVMTAAPPANECVLEITRVIAAPPETVFDAWLKRRTYYAVTNRRVIVLQEGWKRKTSSTFLNAIPGIEREGTATGTLWFGPKFPIIGPRGARKRSMSRFSLDDVPVFADIEDVDSIYRLVTNLREKEARGPVTAQSLTYNS